jgi:hypothetical protein
LATCPIGEVITTNALSSAIGRDVRRVRHIIATARKVAERESGAVFVTLRGVGYQRLTPERASEVLAPTARRHIRRTARRTRSSLETVLAQANDLPADAARRMSREIGVLGVIEMFSRDKIAAPSDSTATRPEPVAHVARDLLAKLGGSVA